MSDFAAVLLVSVRGTLNKEPAYITLEREARLPFAPAPGMWLGLYDDSWLDSETDTVKQALWLVHRGVWVVELATHDIGASDIVSVLEFLTGRGWRAHMYPGRLCPTYGEALAMERANGDPDDPRPIVHLRGGWTDIDPDDLFVLKLSGEAHEVIPTPVLAREGK